MRRMHLRTGNALAALAVTALLTVSAQAQVTPAAGVTPPDDTPSFKVGGTIFADYTYIDSPEITDANGNLVHSSSFNVARAYLNVTGQVNHLVSFRITPDVARETGTGSSLTGSQNFRLKYAYAQLNLDDWTTKGSWIRAGAQQTPLVDYEEQIYRYRFQGPIFVDREGFNGSSDVGVSGHWNIPNGYGDLHGGFYNGEGYNKAETNNEKAFMIRGSIRPLPLGGIWKGLRLTAFVDDDRPVDGGKRNRVVGQVTFEHPLVNAGFDWLDAKDKATVKTAEVSASGWTAWATPKLPNHFELLLRHDSLKPNKDTAQKRDRNIFGVSYWLPAPKGTAAAVMLDYDSLKQKNFIPSRADDTRYGVKILLNF